MKFLAEIIEVKAKRTASVDKEIKIVLVTDEEEAIQLQEFIAKDVVVVDITPKL